MGGEVSMQASGAVLLYQTKCLHGSGAAETLYLHHGSAYRGFATTNFKSTLIPGCILY